MKSFIKVALVTALATGTPAFAADEEINVVMFGMPYTCLLYTSPSPRDATLSRMPSSA